MSLISEEQIGKILYFYMDNGFGCPSKQYENARYAIHQAILETAEECAKICDGTFYKPDTRANRDLNAAIQRIAAEIRRRARSRNEPDF